MLRALPVLSVVLLAGCGVAGTEFHPGVAAQVGDDTITTKHVDQVTADYCAGVQAVLKAEGQDANLQPRPGRTLTQSLANDLVTRSAVEQLAEDYDVEPTATFKSGLAQLDTVLVKLDDDQRDAVIEYVSAAPFAQDLLTTIGGVELSKNGGGETSDDDKYAAGQDLLKTWIAEHDVEVNPKYGLDVGTGSPVDTDLSYPLSSTAKDGLSPDASTNYAAALPDSQFCLLPPPQ
jgi:peptidyl-prolyl cis-trans isomerase SurA